MPCSSTWRTCLFQPTTRAITISVCHTDSMIYTCSVVPHSHCGFSYRRPGPSSWRCLSTQDVAVRHCVTHRRSLPKLSTFTIPFRLGRAKSHIIFCDSDLNSLSGVYLNSYQNFLVIGMRMHHYLRSWGANIHKNVKFIHSMFQQSSWCAYR